MVGTSVGDVGRTPVAGARFFGDGPRLDPIIVGGSEDGTPPLIVPDGVRRKQGLSAQQKSNRSQHG